MHVLNSLNHDVSTFADSTVCKWMAAYVPIRKVRGSGHEYLTFDKGVSIPVVWHSLPVVWGGATSSRRSTVFPLVVIAFRAT